MVDEVQTGIGRTGAWFAHQHNQIEPDVMTLAKGLGNGFPIGACLARGQAATVLSPGTHGSTFGGNPLASRAALATLNAIESNHLIGQATLIGDAIVNGLKARLSDCQAVKEYRNKGLMIGIELDRPCAEIVDIALEHRLLLNVTASSVVRLLPPLVLTEDETEYLVSTLADVIRKFLKQST